MGRTVPLSFAWGKEAQLAECETVFRDSPLFDRYFSDDDRLFRSLRDAAKEGELLVAASDGEIVGVMEVRFTGFFGAFPYLALLGVKKGWRGAGVGGRMLDFYEEAARQLGYDKVSLMVSDFNPRARNFYQKRGYKKIGQVDDPFKKGIRENILVKELA